MATVYSERQDHRDYPEVAERWSQQQPGKGRGSLGCGPKLWHVQCMHACALSMFRASRSTLLHRRIANRLSHVVLAIATYMTPCRALVHSHIRATPLLVIHYNDWDASAAWHGRRCRTVSDAGALVQVSLRTRRSFPISSLLSTNGNMSWPPMTSTRSATWWSLWHALRFCTCSRYAQMTALSAQAVDAG